jgi:hypothetical protein
VLARWFEDTVSALTYSIIRAHGGPAYSPRHNDVVRFVVEQHGRAPDHLRLPLVLATCAFDLSAVPLAGRPFRRLPPERRERTIAAWARAPLGAFRDLIRFYEALVVFGWTSLRDEESRG